LHSKDTKVHHKHNYTITYKNARSSPDILLANEKILLANLRIQFADFPLKLYSVTPYTPNIDNLMRIIVRWLWRANGTQEFHLIPPDFQGACGHTKFNVR